MYALQCSWYAMLASNIAGFLCVTLFIHATDMQLILYLAPNRCSVA